MSVQFKALSLSHRFAPVEVRERFHLAPDAVARLLGSLQELLGLEEAMILSTCNRTEVYYAAEEDRSLDLIRTLCAEKGILDSAPYQRFFEIHTTEEAAVFHLFEVSMGLHSSVLGDLQISNQVKQAYSLSCEYKTAGPFLHRLLHTIFHANKRVQQETPWRDGAASVSYASAELAAELASGLTHPSVLVVGLGEMGLDVARNLDREAFSRMVFCNRTQSKAEALASELSAEVLPFDQLEQGLRQFDLILVALSTENPVVLPEHFQGLPFRPKYLIDLGVPRCISPEVERIPGLLLYSIDEIRNRTDAALRRRMEAIPQVQAIIRQEMEGFQDWSQELSISPTIHKLKEALEQIRREEIARHLKNAGVKEADLVDKVTKSMMNKIIKLPVLQLKAACKRGEAETLIDLLHDLFDLEKVESLH